MADVRSANRSAESAKELLVYYFEQVKPGISQGDCRVELRELVDHIIDAAVAEMGANVSAEPVPVDYAGEVVECSECQGFGTGEGFACERCGGAGVLKVPA